MKNEKLMAGQFFFQKRIEILSENISSKVWGNRWGAEFGPERDGTGSVSQHSMTKKDY